MNRTLALDHLEKAIALDPTHLEARLALAELYSEEKNTGKAIELLEEGIGRELDSPLVRTALAKLLISEGKNDQAMEHLEAAAEGNLGDPDSRFQIAKLLSDQGKSKGAADQLAKVVELDPLNGEAHFLLALLLNHPDDFDRAKLLLEIAMDLMPEDERPFYQLAELLIRGEKTDHEGNLYREPDTEEAAKLYEKVLKLSPEHGHANLRLGRILEESGDLTAAKKLFELAARDESSAGNAYLQLADMSEAQDDLDATLDFLAQAIKSKESKAVALWRRAKILWDKKQTKLVEEDLKKSLEVFDKDEKQFRNASNISSENADFAQARRELDKADKARKSMAPVLLLSAKIKLQQKQLGLALELLEKAISLSPNFAEARHELAKLLDANGRVEEAASQYESTVQADWCYPEAHFKLGQIAWEEGNLEKAEMHYRIVLDLEVNHGEAKAALQKLERKLRTLRKKAK